MCEPEKLDARETRAHLFTIESTLCGKLPHPDCRKTRDPVKDEAVERAEELNIKREGSRALGRAFEADGFHASRHSLSLIHI